MNLIALSYFEGFGNVLVFALFGALFVFVNLFVIGKVIMRRPHKPDSGQKAETFECGEPTMGDSWIRFDIRFYTLMLIFLIFDIEIAMLFPWARVYNQFIAAGHGLYAFIEMLVFLGVLTLGLVYCWLRKDLEWTSTRPGQAVPEQSMTSVAGKSLPIEEESAA